MINCEALAVAGNAVIEREGDDLVVVAAARVGVKFPNRVGFVGSINITQLIIGHQAFDKLLNCIVAKSSHVRAHDFALAVVFQAILIQIAFGASLCALDHEHCAIGGTLIKTEAVRVVQLWR